MSIPFGKKRARTAGGTGRGDGGPACSGESMGRKAANSLLSPERALFFGTAVDSSFGTPLFGAVPAACPLLVQIDFHPISMSG